MTSDLDLPWYTETWLVLVVFIVATILFHVLLLRVAPLSDVAWKQVDYVWLSLTVFALVLGASVPRQEIAAAIGETAAARVGTAAMDVRSSVEAGARPEACAERPYMVLSPPLAVFLKVEADRAARCRWFNGIADLLPTLELAGGRQFDIAAFGPPPPGNDQSYYDRLSRAVEEYNTVVRRRDELAEATQYSTLEVILAIVWLWVLAVALALRLTKVTWEVKQVPRSTRTT